MSENNQPLEEQVRERLCQRLLETLDLETQYYSPSYAKTLAEAYAILFGQYQPSKAAITSPSTQSIEMTNEEKVAKINKPSEEVRQRQESTEGGPEILGRLG